MTLQILLTPQELSSSHVLVNLLHRPQRNLGCAILIAAIDDYQSLDDHESNSAAQFLYARDAEHREHYDWVVAMATGVDARWLRSVLDEARTTWDKHREHRKLRAHLNSTLRQMKPGSGAVLGAQSGSAMAGRFDLGLLESPASLSVLDTPQGIL